MKALSVLAFASCLVVTFASIKTPCALASDTTTHPQTQSADSSYRLPTTVLPNLYDLHFIPHLDTFKFNGTAGIEVSVQSPTDTIVMNALDLNVTSARISPLAKTGTGGGADGTVSLDSEHEQIRIKFPSNLEAGSYKLNLVFDGELNDKLRGFYRSHYVNDKGEKRWLATTQMEPTDARRMFPCFDEPEMKAQFKIQVTIDSNLDAISNGRKLSTVKNPATKDVPTETKTFSFEASPKMSSYLVALIIGDFKSTETQIVDGVPITVWALSGKEQLGNYALNAAGKILRYQRKYFGIAYPGKKLDLIAIPDFRSGAMENLGAITFREANLLVDEKTGSNAAKRTVVAIVAHEIAHQWFGDLVTMRWWNDIWLNEAFASWMGTKTVEAIHPEWQELTKAIETRNSSMLIDELQATRAIHSNVSDPKQAAEMFDSITYDKGESILWMLENYVGAAKFQKGIQDYLKAHLFGNATSEDLWNAIGKASSLPVPELMKSWVFQPGFPIIALSTTSGGSSPSVNQERYFGMPGVSPDELLWQVPAVMRELKPFSSKAVPSTRIIKEKTQPADLPKGWKQVLLNAGGRGFYRTICDTETRKTIREHFDWLTQEERLAYLSDLSALTWKGALPVQERLSMSLTATKENAPIVQERLVEMCVHPHDYLEGSNKKLFEAFLQNVLGPVKSKYGWDETEGELDSVKDLRRLVLTVLGTYGQDKQTILEARERYKSYMKDRSSVSADVAGAVLTIAAYNGDATEYNEILAALKTERVPELEKRFLNSLAYFGQPELIDKTLNMVLSEDVRSQDGFRVLAAMLGRERTKQKTWAFIKERWSDVTKKFPPRSLSTLAYACESFDKPEEEEDVKAFFATHDLPYARSAVARMLENLHRKVLYRQKNESAIRAWVKEQASEPPVSNAN